VGYKVHLTETCEEGTPHLITHVETTAAPVADGEVTTRIHETLAQKSLLPSTHLVDTGYVDGPLLAASQRTYGVELLGPTRADYHWQAHEQEGFAASNFTVDWQKQQAICPQERRSVSWTPAKDRSDRDVIKIKFASADCGACVSRKQCTHSRRPAPYTHDPARRRIPCTAGGPSARSQRGVYQTVWSASRRRRHDLARCPSLRVA